jgi:hypothetical protein
MKRVDFIKHLEKTDVDFIEKVLITLFILTMKRIKFRQCRDIER